MKIDVKKINFIDLSKDDIDLLYEWKNKDFVKEWYGKKSVSYEETKNKYISYIEGKKPTKGYIIKYDNMKIGYIQTYMIRDYPEYDRYVKADDNSAGLDLFIGEENYIHIGMGEHIIRKFLKEIVFKNKRVGNCIIGPEPKNKIAIRVYKKVGFRYLKTIQIPDEKEAEYLLKITFQDLLNKEKTAIRRVKKYNEKLIQKIVNSFYESIYSKELGQKFFNNPNNYLYLGLYEGNIVSLIVGYKMDRIDNKSMFCIYSVDTLPEYRRKGIAGNMIEEIINDCRKEKMYKVWVITNKSNIPASKLYESVGGEYKNIDDIVYLWNIVE